MQAISRRLYQFSNIPLPNKIGLLGYGAIGKAFTEIVLKQYPKANIVAVDMENTFQPNENRFKAIPHKVTRHNVNGLFDLMGLKSGDFLVDLSTNVDFNTIWPLCFNNNIRYMNSALEIWEDEDYAVSYPDTADQAYKLSLGFIRDKAMTSKIWNTEQGPTSLLEMGYNPGMISSCVKRGLEDCAKYEIANTTNEQLRSDLKKYYEARNHSKLAQLLEVHTIHCSEIDTQLLEKAPKDLKKKLYNTWSCRGFLTEGMVPIQVARGSHEDKEIDDMFVIRDGKTIVSKKPSVQTWANSWVPNENIKGVLIPHGEAYSIYEYLHDPETGYAPSQYYVYDYNIYAKLFVESLPKGATLQDTCPKMEVIHPINHPSLKGYDKVGALLIRRNNKAWWTGSVMDEVDSSAIFNGRFSPTVLQVAGSAYAGFLWACQNPNKGCRYPEHIDTDFVIDKCLPYLGRLVSKHVDLTKTSIKDCHKLQSFICEAPKFKI